MKKKDILELLLDLSEQVEDIRCRAIEIDLQNSDAKQFSTITNKGNLYKYPDGRTYEDVMKGP